MQISLSKDCNHKAAELQIGAVTLFFSYNSLIAFEGRTDSAFDPRYRGYSKTTGRHINALGLKELRDAKDSEEFAARVRSALADI